MRSRALVVFALACPFIVHISGQSVISARSGLVNYFEGNVFLDGRPLVRKFGTFARLAPGSTLLTQSGRAEVLLTPNVYFRMGENSTIRMISDSLADTQVELLAGSASVDSANAPAGDFVKMIFRDSTIRTSNLGATGSMRSLHSCAFTKAKPMSRAAGAIRSLSRPKSCRSMARRW